MSKTNWDGQNCITSLMITAMLFFATYDEKTHRYLWGFTLGFNAALAFVYFVRWGVRNLLDGDGYD